jgi:hypothetical protein
MDKNDYFIAGVDPLGVLSLWVWGAIEKYKGQVPNM